MYNSLEELEIELKEINFNKKIEEHIKNINKLYKECNSYNSIMNYVKTIPKRFLTQRLKIACVVAETSTLRLFSKKQQNEELCLYAFEQGDYIPFKDIKIQTQSIVNEIFKQEPYNVDSIEEKYLNEESFTYLVEYNRQGLRYIDDKYQSLLLCEKAYKRNIGNISYMRDDLLLELINSKIVTIKDYNKVILLNY